jgi:hypothetical protein
MNCLKRKCKRIALKKINDIELLIMQHIECTKCCFNKTINPLQEKTYRKIRFWYVEAFLKNPIEFTKIENKKVCKNA